MALLTQLVTHVIKSPNEPELRLDPVGRCIYCLKDSIGTKLGEEHVLASGLGGHLILPDASCRECEKIINQFETNAMREYLGLIRNQLNIKSRRSRGKRAKDRTAFPIFDGEPIDGDDDFRIKNGYRSRLVDELPHVMFYEMYDGRPSLISGSPVPRMQISTINCGEGTDPGTNFGITGTVRVGDYIRTIAKTAHAFAVSVLGVDAFEPFLIETILSGISEQTGKFIGSFFGEEISALHWIGLNPSGVGITRTGPTSLRHETLYVVYVQLFAEFGTPTYEVVVGSPRGK
jgi:hypothetical protein